MPASEIYVVEWKDENGEWEPTLEVAYTIQDIQKRMRFLKQSLGNKYRKFRIKPYGRKRG